MYESVNWPGFKLSPFIFARVGVRACCEREREKERFLLARQIINNQAGVCAVLARFANEPAFSRCRLEAYNYMLASILVCAPPDIYIYVCMYAGLSIGCSNQSWIDRRERRLKAWRWILSMDVNVMSEEYFVLFCQRFGELIRDSYSSVARSRFLSMQARRWEGGTILSRDSWLWIYIRGLPWRANDFVTFYHRLRVEENLKRRISFWREILTEKRLIYSQIRYAREEIRFLKNVNIWNSCDSSFLSI